MSPFFHTVSTSLGPESISRRSNCRIFKSKALPHCKSKRLNAKDDVCEFCKYLSITAGFSDESK